MRLALLLFARPLSSSVGLFIVSKYNFKPCFTTLNQTIHAFSVSLKQYPSPSPPSLTARSLGTKSRCPIPRRPITLQNESAEAWLLWALSSVDPSPSSTALRTAGRGRCGVKAGTGGGEGGGEGGGDGGGVGQGEGEGRSRSGARVADDSSVSSKRPCGFLGVGGAVDSEHVRVFKSGELGFALRSLSSHSGWVLVTEVTDLVGGEDDDATSGVVKRDWCSGYQLGKKPRDAQRNTTQQREPGHPRHATWSLIQFIYVPQNLDRWTRCQWRPLSLCHCQSPVTATRCDKITVRKWCVGAAFGIMLSLPATCQTHFENQSHYPLSSSSAKLPQPIPIQYAVA